MDDTYRSQFRLPWSVYLQLKEAAQESGRSLNGELVALLSASLARKSGEPAKPAPLSTEQLAKVLQQITLPNLLTANELETVAKRLQKLLDSDT
ncbi:Arc family DNA-binding protein [Burkholderia cepacia]|uniref:Arc family DNA-binding protein n=1 Tax=Burkholderia cepacia TaxID=292 RepID=UPI001CF47605|nr:Arc family DNA-binding protein [Burkholderia cepacia]MCA7941729.1 Arc family DNA-binding protein [Burkholderia cepacia]